MRQFQISRPCFRSEKWRPRGDPPLLLISETHPNPPPLPPHPPTSVSCLFYLFKSVKQALCIVSHRHHAADLFPAVPATWRHFAGRHFVLRQPGGRGERGTCASNRGPVFWRRFLGDLAQGCRLAGGLRQRQNHMDPAGR
jgi:hypothetical protein